MSIIRNSNYISHTDPIFKDLKILKIKDLYKINILKLYFQVKTPSFNCLSHSFQTLDFTVRSDVHSYNTGKKMS